MVLKTYFMVLKTYFMVLKKYSHVFDKEEKQNKSQVSGSKLWKRVTSKLILKKHKTPYFKLKLTPRKRHFPKSTFLASK